jgi:hypothetical protein
MIHRSDMKLCEVTYSEFQQLRHAMGKKNRREKPSDNTSWYRIVEPIHYKDFLELCYRAKETRAAFRASYPRRMHTGKIKWQRFAIPYDFMGKREIREIASDAHNAGVMFVHFKTRERDDHEIAFEEDGRVYSVEIKLPRTSARHYRWESPPKEKKYIKGIYLPPSRRIAPSLLHQRIEQHRVR